MVHKQSEKKSRVSSFQFYPSRRIREYNDRVKLAFDLIRSAYGDFHGEDDEATFKSGKFQFYLPRKDGKGMKLISFIKPEDKITLANKLLVRATFAPVNYKGKEVQAFSGSDSVPRINGGNAWSVSCNNREYDMGYQPLYYIQPLKPNSRKFEIGIGKRGARMEKIPEGGRVKIAGFGGNVLQVECEKYGLGFGITWEMMTDNNYAKFREEYENYEAELYGIWADVMYGIIRGSADDSSNSVTPWDTAGATTKDKDINTINQASVDLLTAVKDMYGNAANAKLYIVGDLNVESRIMRALRSATNPEDDAAVYRMIEFIPTMNTNILPTSGNKLEPIMVLPGRRLQRAIHTNNLALKKTDIESLTEIHTGWTAFGAGNGNIYQTRRFRLHS